VRGALIVAGLVQLKRQGNLARYHRHLSGDDRASIETVVAERWYPCTVADAHFTAIDALQLSESDAIVLSRTSGETVHRWFVQLGGRLLRSTGITPWTAMPMFKQAWDRNFEGGAIGVQKVDPTAAHIVVQSHPLLRHTFHRLGLRTHVAIYLEVCATNVHVTEIECDPDAGSMVLLGRWS
jgi:hypothetical protein